MRTRSVHLASDTGRSEQGLRMTTNDAERTLRLEQLEADAVRAPKVPLGSFRPQCLLSGGFTGDVVEQLVDYRQGRFRFL